MAVMNSSGSKTRERTNLKQTPIPVVPRTLQITNPDGTPTRSGQLLLQQLQAPSATVGTHGTRPDSANLPDGTLYTESDRGVLYQNYQGAWYYLAGTMWGTISPDQRPTDLGANDVGFAFRGTDQSREFLWSGRDWIEVTPSTIDTHAARLASDPSDYVQGALWFESDRYPAVYQADYASGTPTWVWVAGTMFGTLIPDQRPTDLGANDAGFTFRGSDQQREFIWSGGAWIEVTPGSGITVDTHAARLTSAPSHHPPGALWFESDRYPAVYQADYASGTPTWVWVAGTMWGTLSPDQRPTDLGTNDAGFAFRGTDQQREFLWSGGAWVETTPQANTAQIAYSSANLTLTTAWQTIPGLTLTLPLAGRYFIQGVFYFTLAPADASSLLLGGCTADGLAHWAVLASSIAGEALNISMPGQWLYTASSPNTSVSLQAYKTGGTGASTVGSTHSSISAWWIGP
jgi:hypothetical protein